MGGPQPIPRAAERPVQKGFGRGFPKVPADRGPDHEAAARQQVEARHKPQHDRHVITTAALVKDQGAERTTPAGRLGTQLEAQAGGEGKRPPQRPARIDFQGLDAGPKHLIKEGGEAAGHPGAFARRTRDGQEGTRLQAARVPAEAGEGARSVAAEEAGPGLQKHHQGAEAYRAAALPREGESQVGLAPQRPHAPARGLQERE